MTQTPTIQPISIHGKQYITVCDRVRLCNADEGFSMISQERYSIEKRHFISLTIEVKGKRYIGDAEITFDARNPIAQGSPIETAQTSALGRALGFAGYGVLESIASADEVVRASERQEAAPPPPHKAPQPAQTVKAALDDPRSRCNAIWRMGREKLGWRERDDMALYTAYLLDREITADMLPTLTLDELSRVAKQLANEASEPASRREVAA